MQLRTTPFAARLLIVLLAGGLLAFLALRADSHLRTLPWIPQRLSMWADSNGVVRNTAAFFGLGLVAFALLGSGWRISVALAAFATVLEVAQLWIPSRYYDVRDIVASLAGLLLAWGVVRAGAWLLARK